MNRFAKLICSFVVVCLVVGGYLGYQRYQDYQQVSSRAQLAADEYDSRITQPDKQFNIVVDEDRLVSGPSTIRVKKDDSVTVHAAAGGSAEVRLKLDGYDVITEASQGAPGGFKFIADKTGTFAIYSLGEKEDGMTKAPAPVKVGQLIVD